MPAAATTAKLVSVVTIPALVEAGMPGEAATLVEAGSSLAAAVSHRASKNAALARQRRPPTKQQRQQRTLSFFICFSLDQSLSLCFLLAPDVLFPLFCALIGSPVASSTQQKRTRTRETKAQS
jgi:hypothetical protein